MGREGNKEKIKGNKCHASKLRTEREREVREGEGKGRHGQRKGSKNKENKREWS